MLAKEEAGDVSIVGGGNQTLKKGDTKFNMALSQWKWCGTAGGSGAVVFLDVFIEETS